MQLRASGVQSGGWSLMLLLHPGVNWMPAPEFDIQKIPAVSCQPKLTAAVKLSVNQR